MCLCVLCLVAWQPGLGRKRAGEEGVSSREWVVVTHSCALWPLGRGYQVHAVSGWVQPARLPLVELSPEQQELLVGTPGTESQTTAGGLVLPAV